VLVDELSAGAPQVALLLLKGYSHKAIAHHTDRSAQTVRQHAASAYRKAGVSGRAQLSAFFLEDLMLPDPHRAVVRVRRQGGAAGPEPHSMD
jgi:DNA-binding NarL/FixJ family response regulator